MFKMLIKPNKKIIDANWRWNKSNLNNVQCVECWYNVKIGIKLSMGDIYCLIIWFEVRFRNRCQFLMQTKTIHILNEFEIIWLRQLKMCFCFHLVQNFNKNQSVCRESVVFLLFHRKINSVISLSDEVFYSVKNCINKIVFIRIDLALTYLIQSICVLLNL